MEKNYPFFVSDTESAVAILGSRYVEQYLSDGSLPGGFVVVTQLRAYFKGMSNYRDYNGHFKKQTQEKVVDLKDITGTGYITFKRTGMFVASIILLLVGFFIMIGSGGEEPSLSIGFTCLIVGIIFIIVYNCTKSTYFMIEFSGGNICFESKWYGKTVVDTFQNNLQKAVLDIRKNGLEQASVAPVVTDKPTTPVEANGKAETLREYAKLKEDGLISEEEYQQMKAELISGKSE